MPMDWEEWQKSRQKNKGPMGNPLPKMGDAFKNMKMPGGGKFLVMIPLVLALMWASSGVFTVDPAQVGLIKRFGSYVRTVEPGLNYHAPYPIEEVIKVNVNRTNRIDIGGRGHNGGGSQDETMMLTQDENIADIRFVVQYRISDAAKYAFKVYDPDKAIVDAATSAMREVIGRNTIDDALTNKRLAIQDDTISTLQAMLDKYELGILVQNVELQDVQVPTEVQQAFRDVTSAREDSNTSINKAQGYANQVLPEAEGRAFAIEAEANAYKARRINMAQGQATRFSALLAEYKKAPEITRQRLLLENLDQFLPAAETVVITGEIGQSLLPHLGIRPNAPAPAAAPVSPSAAN